MWVSMSSTCLVVGLSQLPLLLQLLVQMQHVYSASIGPIRLWPGRYGFSWEANLNSMTGISSSVETSQVSPVSYLGRQLNSLWPDGIKREEDDVWSEILERFSRYPEWVVRGAVTLGLFQVLPVQGGGFELRDRIFGISFLTFGSPKGRRDASWTAMGRESQCTVTIPIEGGILALCKYKRDKMGFLRMKIKHSKDTDRTLLVTEVDGYCPMLAGSKEPVPFHRKWIYLSSQSLIHAYVMWRFHRYCIHSKAILP